MNNDIGIDQVTSVGSTSRVVSTWYVFIGPVCINDANTSISTRNLRVKRLLVVLYGCLVSVNRDDARHQASATTDVSTPKRQSLCLSHADRILVHMFVPIVMLALYL